MFDLPKQIPNLNRELVADIESKLGLSLDWDAPINISYISDHNGQFTPTDLLDYIYGVLHSPTYRETYKEFLKIDFPRVPFGEDWMKLISKKGDIIEEFWRMVAIGGKLRKLHLFEDTTLSQHGVGYPVSGGNEVTKVAFDDQTRVFINDTQYFSGVSNIAWNFYIGGYQPAQKWLKDRKGRVLTTDDIQHYCQIIGALDQTNELMQNIDD